ncbi:MAG TPA: EamA family transporter [Acidimicrobiales bacterium]
MAGADNGGAARQLATAGLTALAPISWGTNFAVVTEVLPDGRPLLVSAMRVVPPSVLLIAGGWWVSRWRPRAGEWGRIALLSLFNFGLFFPLLSVAMYRLPGGVAAAFGGLGPLLVAGLGWLVARWRPRGIDLAVGVVAAVGVSLVVVGPGAGFDPVGLLAALGANVAFSMAVVLTKRFPTPPDPVAATGWQLLLGGVVLVPLALAVEGAPPSPTLGHALGYAYIGLLSTGLAYVVWFRGIRRLPAPAAPLLTLAAPVTSATVGWALLGESLSVAQLLGFVLALGSIAYGASLVEPAATDGATADDGTRGGTGEDGASPDPEGAGRLRRTAEADVVVRAEPRTPSPC